MEFLIFLVASIPSIVGNPISIITRSGFKSKACSTPSIPSEAVPKTSMDSLFDKAKDNPILVMSWSSIIVTLILFDIQTAFYTLDFATTLVSKNENSLPLLTLLSTQILPP